jgi:hypothetical protein
LPRFLGASSLHRSRCEFALGKDAKQGEPRRQGRNAPGRTRILPRETRVVEQGAETCAPAPRARRRARSCPGRIRQGTPARPLPRDDTPPASRPQRQGRRGTRASDRLDGPSLSMFLRSPLRMRHPPHERRVAKRANANRIGPESQSPARRAPSPEGAFSSRRGRKPRSYRARRRRGPSPPGARRARGGWSPWSPP